MGESEVFARVVFQSALPALDREFDYKVPASLKSEIAVGVRVQVPFAGQTKEGFVVQLASEPSFKGAVSEVKEVISNVPVLAPHIYSLLKAVANRQCCGVGELLERAVPKRAVRVEKSFTLGQVRELGNSSGIRTAELIRPVFDVERQAPSFVGRLVELAVNNLSDSRSVILCVPDFRDLGLLQKALLEKISSEQLSMVSSSDTPSQRYQSFLRQLDGNPQIVLGTRSAIYSPVPANTTLVIWDDGDQSHYDQQSPYLSTRDIALIRQSQFACDIHFLSHSRSTEVQRLIEIGYLSEQISSNWRPKVAVSEGRGLDGTAFKTIKKGLETGPVLFQVASPGIARSLYCESCNSRSMCSNCHGPLWLNAAGKITCRWCGQFNLDFHCSKCSGTKLSQGAAGVTRWVEQLGKSFPGVPIREITADDELKIINAKPAIVVATPGIEPISPVGYSAIVLIDCAAQLSRDSLRAPQDALRAWLNALAYLNPNGSAVAVGVTSEVSRALTLGEVDRTVSELLREREELGFPPAKRIMSATGSYESVTNLSKEVANLPGVKILGIAEAQTTSIDRDFRLIVSFGYAQGAELAMLVRTFLATLDSKSLRKNARSGKSLRPVTIKFDDPRVI